MKNKKVNIVGLGYIGLPTALILAKQGHQIIGTDKNETLVKQLLKGECPFKEEELRKLFFEAKEKIVFTSTLKPAEYYIICVPTPYKESTKGVDTSYLKEAIYSVTEVAKEGAKVIVESTVPPGTIKEIKEEFGKETPLVFAHAPERIMPNNTVEELIHNARIIGVEDPKEGKGIEELYGSFCHGEIVLTDIETAEMTKVVENTFRDVNIAFANELCKICDKAEIDVRKVIEFANKHPRVDILNPGPGVGGHCIAVDPWFLIKDFPEETPLIHAARRVNGDMPKYTLDKIKKIEKQIKINSACEIGIYGIAFKENIGDYRNSPTLQLFQLLSEEEKKHVKFYDPFVEEKLFCNQAENMEEFLEGVKLLVIMVGHEEILLSKELLKDKYVLDTKNVLRKEERVFQL